MRTKRTRELFAQVYDVLVQRAGAHEGMREHFLDTCERWAAKDPYQTNEFRFVGKLGMGGKFWLCPESFHVSCYSEDSTPERREIIEKTNSELKKLFVAPEEAILQPEDECPNCKNGTLERSEDGQLVCRGECGAFMPKEE